jgi:hypothetical protein
MLRGVTAKQEDEDVIDTLLAAPETPRWERVGTEDQDGGTARLAVPGGWLYRETYVGAGGQLAVALAVVPDLTILPPEIQLANALLRKEVIDDAAKALGAQLESAGIFLATSSKVALVAAVLEAAMDAQGRL